ncbi:MAG: hypothetical protein WCF12_09780 [Propionicimonas sp.]
MTRNPIPRRTLLMAAATGAIALVPTPALAAKDRKGGRAKPSPTPTPTPAPTPAPTSTLQPVTAPLSPFVPYIATGTVFTRAVNGAGSVATSQSVAMPLAANSATIAATMIPYSQSCNRFGVKTSFNTASYNIPVYVVNSGDPNQTYATMSSTDSRVTANASIAANTLGRIPLPAWARPAPSGDFAMAVYDSYTGMMREYFSVQGGAGGFTCRAAGYYQASQMFTNLATSNFWMRMTAGSNSVVGMFNTLSQVGIEEALSGTIGHALSFTIANAAGGFSWPARQGDGTATNTNLPYQGQWFRIDPAVNLDSLGLPPFTLMLAKAAQTYGGFAADKNLFCHAFNAEPSNSYVQATGGDPWQTTIPAKFGSNYADLNTFPWQLTQWAPKDWGKP